MITDSSGESSGALWRLRAIRTKPSSSLHTNNTSVTFVANHCQACVHPIYMYMIKDDFEIQAQQVRVKLVAVMYVIQGVAEMF